MLVRYQPPDFMKITAQPGPDPLIALKAESGRSPLYSSQVNALTLGLEEGDVESSATLKRILPSKRSQI